MFSAVPIRSDVDPLFARYEHASALCGDELILFGGANQDKPFSDVWSLSIDVKLLSRGPVTDLTVTDLFPATPSRIQPANADAVSERTQHTSSCLTEHDELVVFAGGALGCTPVDDVKVSVLLFFFISTSASMLVAKKKTFCHRYCNILLLIKFQNAEYFSEAQKRLARLLASEILWRTAFAAYFTH
ncbi:unnamed protein product [Dibothriocephalus latus]|uniref:Uncharacterized protein n=1 Tax=Dibothriocephalus latus TaxID=60516 RepID=A0A3P7LPV6_DIBLA|nr:unnamed protein product [Dibothriocephalus latus]